MTALAMISVLTYQKPGAPSIDDALRAANAAAIQQNLPLYLPAGNYTLARPGAVVGALAVDQLWNNVTLLGDGPTATRIRYAGPPPPTGGAVLYLSGQQACTGGGWSLTNTGAGRAWTGVCLASPFDHDGGTTSTRHSLYGVSADGFGTGLQVGTAQAAASEVRLVDCTAYRCATGFGLGGGWNSENVTLDGCSALNCATGVDAQANSLARLLGCTFGGSQLQDVRVTNGGDHLLECCYSEQSHEFLWCQMPGNSAGGLTVRNCRAQALTGPWALEVGGSLSVALEGCRFHAPVGVTRSDAPHGLDLFMSRVRCAGAVPFAQSEPGQPLTGLRWQVHHCREVTPATGADEGRYNDQGGLTPPPWVTKV